tara:strand:+ start:3402 stop:3944 length:543 start_codon:yes stop_codon:yes gene_type:complete
MPFSVQDLRAQLGGGGARPNLFEVVMPFPSIAPPASAAQKLTFTCKGAQLPGGDIGTIEVPYFGRTVKVPGNRTFAEWTTTVINDEDFQVHNAIESWMDAINSHVANLRDPAAATSTGHTTNALIRHYGKDGSVIKEVEIVNAWPSSLAPIDLAWDSNDTLEEFTCTWQYDYWQVAGITS